MELHAYEEMAEALETALTEAPTSVFPPVTPPGMAYVPYQQWGEIYESDRGLRQGTMFPVLDYPFYGGACNEKT